MSIAMRLRGVSRANIKDLVSCRHHGGMCGNTCTNIFPEHLLGK